jgi:hypothetical protein
MNALASTILIALGTLFLISIPVMIVATYGTSNTLDAIIVVQAKFDTHADTGKYLIASTEGNIYKTTDDKIYNDLVVGRTYLVEYHVSPYHEIVKITQSTSLETNPCYLKGVANGISVINPDGIGGS